MTTETEKPQDTSGSQRGKVLSSGQLGDDTSVRTVLELVRKNETVEHGVIRILSKDVRGHIGVYGGKHIVGGHILSTNESGREAVKKLLSATKGMYAILSMPQQQPELKQSLWLNIDDILNWQPDDGFMEAKPPLDDALQAILSDMEVSISDIMTISEDQFAESLLVQDTEEQFATMSDAWGGEGSPETAAAATAKISNLGEILGGKRTVESKAAVEPMVAEEASPPTETPKFELPPPPNETPKFELPPPPTAMPTGEFEAAEDQTMSGRWAAAKRAAEAERSTAKPAAQEEDQTMSGRWAAARRAAEAEQSARPEEPNKKPATRWTLADLNAIPTPKADGSAPEPVETTSEGRGRPKGPLSQTKAPKKSEETPAKSPDKKAPSTQPSSPEAKAAQAKTVAEEQATSQRMRALQTNIDYVPPIQEAKGVGKTAIVGGIVGVGLLIVLASQSFEAIKYSGNLSAGMDALKNGKNDEAQVDFSESVSANPLSADAYFYRALAEARLGQTDAALNDYSSAIALSPKDPFKLIARATLYNKLKKYDDALTDCDNALRIDDKFTDAYRVRAMVNNKKGEYNQAIVDCRWYLQHYDKHDKSRADVLANRAYAFFHKREFDKAINDYTDAISNDPQNGTLYASRAVAFKQVHDWKRAVDDCNAAIKLLPGDSTLFKVRGLCYAGLGQTEESLKDLDGLVKFNPTLENHRMRGTARLQVHDYKGALEDFDYILAAKPHDQDAKVKYEQARLGLQSTAKATSAIADAVVQKPEKREPIDLKLPEPELVKRGYDRMRAGDADQAVQYLTAAVRSNPNDPSARRYLAYAFVEQGQNAGAAEQFQSLEKLQALPPEDQMMFAKSLVAAQKLNDAIGVYCNILGSNPQNDNARAELIKAYIAAGEKDKATRLAKEGIEKSPALAGTYQQLLKQADAIK